MCPMLKFAVVGTHGRDLRTRLAVCAIATVLWVVPLRPQAALDDLLPELAARIAALVASDSQVSLAASAQDSNGSTARRIQEAMAALLASRGVRVVDAGEGITSVGLSCSENLRERSCLAEVHRNSRREVLMVTRPHDGTVPAESRPALSLELRPLFVQRTPILDVVHLGERLLVLDAASVALYQQDGQGWERVRSRPLPLSRASLRDLRGRLRVEGDEFAALLPGVACSGRLGELTLACAESRPPWPLGIENSGLEEARNYFNTPEGFSFYSAALLGADAGARWLVADRNGTLSVLDAGRRPLARVGTAGDVAGIVAPCGTDSYVIAAELSGEREAVRLFQVARQRLVPIGSPVFVTGKLTAMWAAPAAAAATVVGHDITSGRYEAFLATVSCGR